MSDLQCPVTLLVARHGDATYPVPGVLTDDGGRLTDKGAAQATELAERLRSRRVAAVFTSTMNRAVETGRIMAERLGSPVRVIEGLQEFSVGDLAGVPYRDPRPQSVFDAWLDGDLSVGCPGAETGLDVVRRYEGAIAGIADEFRGETVAVISHGGVMSLVLPRLADNTPNDLARQRFLPNCVPAELAVDGDGWLLVSWPGSTDRSVV
ncbi:MAG: histidine phosphatase family protein [Kineosporiaceae bacterium]